MGSFGTLAHALVAGVAGSSDSMTISEILGLFNIFVGLMLVAALLSYVGGLITWWVLLGLVGRTQGLHIMEWGVVILFVLVVLLAIDQFFLSHPAVATTLVAAVVIIFFVYMIVSVIGSGGGEAGHEE